TWGLYLFVKARNQDLTFAILQFADDLSEREERVRGCATVHAGVQVRLSAKSFNLRVNETTQANAQGRKVGRKQLGIANQGKISFQFGFLLTNVLRDRLTTNFFLTFDDELDVQRQLAIVPFHQGFDSFDFHPELAFVVHGSAGIDIVVTL